MTMIVIGAPPRSLAEQIAELETTLVYVQATVFQEEGKGNFALARYWREQARRLEREIQSKRGH